MLKCSKLIATLPTIRRQFVAPSMFTQIHQYHHRESIGKWPNTFITESMKSGMLSIDSNKSTYDLKDTSTAAILSTPSKCPTCPPCSPKSAKSAPKKTKRPSVVGKMIGSLFSLIMRTGIVTGAFLLTVKLGVWRPLHPKLNSLDVVRQEIERTRMDLERLIGGHSSER